MPYFVSSDVFFNVNILNHIVKALKKTLFATGRTGVPSARNEHILGFVTLTRDTKDKVSLSVRIL
jgi:hypothetical protein